jgi:hypothetical protein
MMEIFINLFEQDNYLAKREGMKILHEILLDKSHKKDFITYFVSEKSHLKFTMQALNDDQTAIQKEAFYLLLIFLKTSPERRGERVNGTLKRNSKPLLLFVEEFTPNANKTDESFEAKKKEAMEAIENLE